MSTLKTTFCAAHRSLVARRRHGAGLALRHGTRVSRPDDRADSTDENSAPITQPLDATTFNRNIAKAQQPMVVNCRTEVEGEESGSLRLLRRRWWWRWRR